jgi:hypothetical protein
MIATRFAKLKAIPFREISITHATIGKSNPITIAIVTLRRVTLLLSVADKIPKDVILILAYWFVGRKNLSQFMA